MVVPLFVGREKSVRALERAMAGDRTLLLAAQKDAKSDDPGRDEIHELGTLGSIVQLVPACSTAP
jgi:ATP-dependent Lon protease